MDVKKLENLRKEFTEKHVRAQAYLDISKMLSSEVDSLTRRMAEISDEIAALRGEKDA